jgi:hypothetical protein
MSFQDGWIFVTRTRHSVSGYFPVVPLARAPAWPPIKRTCRGEASERRQVFPAKNVFVYLACFAVKDLSARPLADSRGSVRRGTRGETPP